MTGLEKRESKPADVHDHVLMSYSINTLSLSSVTHSDIII